MYSPLHRGSLAEGIHRTQSMPVLERQDDTSSSTRSLHKSQRSRLEAANAMIQFERKELELRKAQMLEEEQMMRSAAEKRLSVIEAELQLLRKEKDAAMTEAKMRSISGNASEYTDNESVHSSMNSVKFVPKEPTELNPNAPTFNPTRYTGCMDVAKFLMKKDLLLHRFTRFTDSPESFISWKTSFLSITRELNVSALEEFDLLIKWLGPESQKAAISLRTSNASNPERGLERLWMRLHERYGCPERVEMSVRDKLSKFPKITSKDNQKLYELSDILSEIESLMEDDMYTLPLSFYNSSTGVLPIVTKLPFHIQGKWTVRATKYKKRHHVMYPPFSEFVEFIREMASMLNDPGLNTDLCLNACAPPSRLYVKPSVQVKTTSVDRSGPRKQCLLHGSGHSLNQCRTFRNKSLRERRRILAEHNYCFRCCETDKHIFKNCNRQVKCVECQSEHHVTALHPIEGADYSPAIKHGGEHETHIVDAKCTEVCGGEFVGRSCSKTLLVKAYHKDNPENSQLIYVIIDDQSNRTLCRPELLSLFNIKDKSAETTYSLVSCGGNVQMCGSVLHDLVLTAVDNSFSIDIQNALECDMIPDSREEIPTPDVTEHYEHLKDLPVPQLEPDARILLLIGRDVPEAHHVYEQRTGPLGTPFAQKLGLGWSIIGNVCLGQTHPSNKISVRKTWVVNGRPTIFPPCENQINVKENDIFIQTRDDNKVGPSFEDKEFLILMNNQFERNALGQWVAPLPFRTNRARLPTNRTLALKRAHMLDVSLCRNEIKKQHMLTFMKGILENGHAELAPPLKENEEHWYLPLFGVYHPRKPDKIRGVFDSSSKYEGLSLNDVLMKGPDMVNSLLGVLLRFREGKTAVMADIENMFYCFSVREDHRNFLRFYWYQDNDTSKPMIEYRMCKHVFGNSPSPAVAAYGLRKTAELVEKEFGSDVRDFVDRHFYVDDALISFSSTEEAVSLLDRSQKALQTAGIRLHKISSNDPAVLQAFPQEDLACNLRDFAAGSDKLPCQSSLGLCWDLQGDSFLFKMLQELKPFTKRGVLSTVNSLFDPIGFLSPVTVQAKILLRDMMESGSDWDEPLPDSFSQSWKQWVNALHDLETLRIPRQYRNWDYGRRELHVYTDASQKAISAVVYMKCDKQVSFVLGKSKVAPKSGHTIPRLELCAAVLGTEIAQIVTDELDIDPSQVCYYSDSKVVLGYLNNHTRRFYVYVANRIGQILNFTSPCQWSYVLSEDNPADVGTRFIQPAMLAESCWIKGPEMLKSESVAMKAEQFTLIKPNEDSEIRAEEVKVMKTVKTTRCGLGTDRFKRFSKWSNVVRAISFLKRVIRIKTSKGQNVEVSSVDVETKDFILKELQHEYFEREVMNLSSDKSVPRDSHVLRLSPFLDKKGLLRVGGRLQKSSIPYKEKCPILIPGRSHIAHLLTCHYHEQVQHQGRHLTEGTIRAAGYWITGGKRLVASVIHHCVKCRRLRGKVSHQKMADLPLDRLTPSPPFTYVGVDVFGPWNVTTRRTRGGIATNKRWAVLYTCMTTRAIHIELLEEMSSSSFINATRRFYAIRGKVQEFRSDCGTNFVGAASDLNAQVISVGDECVQKFLKDSHSIWRFNPPHASHFGGAWERMIGVVRRILESMLLDNKRLTHEILSTLMAEVVAIVNARPLVPVSTDPECPFILSPSVLLTQKVALENESFSHLGVKDTYKAQWKYVQYLAEQFWARWRREYLPTVQCPRKWNDKSKNIKEGDVVLMKEEHEPRNDWPIGVITRVFSSADELVRKVEVRTTRNSKPALYIRPITQIVLLCSEDDA